MFVDMIFAGAKIFFKLENDAKKKEWFLSDSLKQKLSLFESKHYFYEKNHSFSLP